MDVPWALIGGTAARLQGVEAHSPNLEFMTSEPALIALGEMLGMQSDWGQGTHLAANRLHFIRHNIPVFVFGDPIFHGPYESLAPREIPSLWDARVRIEVVGGSVLCTPLEWELILAVVLGSISAEVARPWMAGILLAIALMASLGPSIANVVIAIGVVYTLVGLVGFFLTGFDGFASPDGALLLGIFEVNPLHNIVHLAIGIGGLALWNRLDLARWYGWLLFIIYGGAFLYGLFFANTDEPANFLALNQADNWLHVLSSLAGLAIALWPAARGRAEPRADTRGVERR